MDCRVRRGTRRGPKTLRQSEVRFHMMLSNRKDDSVITLDTKGRVNSWNGAAERITGYASADMIGKYVSIFYTPEKVAIGKPTTEIETAIQSGRFADDGWRVRKDGSRFCVNAVVTPLQDEAGLVRGIVEITRDTTEKREAEQALLGRSAELKNILTTSKEDQGRMRGYGLGANSFVRKQVEFDRFIEAVRQLGLYWLILNEAAPVARRF